MISTQRFADVLVVKVTGRLDHDTSERFSSGLIGAMDRELEAGQSLVLDLSGLDYASSSGLNSLMAASRHAKAQRRNLLVAELQPLVAEMFSISHLNLLMRVFPTVHEALEMASSQAADAYEAWLPKGG